MSAYHFLESLQRELEEVLAHFSLKRPEGGSGRIRVFCQGVPESSACPYVAVRIKKGVFSGKEAQKVRVCIEIGLYDDQEEEGQGQMLHVIHDITERFLKNPVLDGFCYGDERIVFKLPKEETVPYFYGSVKMSFYLPAFRREATKHV